MSGWLRYSRGVIKPKPLEEEDDFLEDPESEPTELYWQHEEYPEIPVILSVDQFNIFWAYTWHATGDRK